MASLVNSQSTAILTNIIKPSSCQLGRLLPQGRRPVSESPQPRLEGGVLRVGGPRVSDDAHQLIHLAGLRRVFQGYNAVRTWGNRNEAN